jgi:hypothetical protein
MKLAIKKTKTYKPKKKALKRSKKEVFFIYDILPPAEIKKIAKKVAGIKKYKSGKERMLAFSWRVALATFLIICFLTGFAPVRFIHHWISALSESENSQNTSFIFYPRDCSGDWQNLQKVLGVAEVSSGGSFYDFSDSNSAFYSEGKKSLLCQNFQEYEENQLIEIKESIVNETSTETLKENENQNLKSEKEINSPKEQKKEEEIKIEPDNNIETDIKGEGTERIINPEESEIPVEQNKEVEPEINFEIKEVETGTENQSEIKNTENIEENERGASFLNKIREYFDSLKTTAQENQEFKSVKIQLSFAIGEKIQKEEENIKSEAEAVNSSTEGDINTEENINMEINTYSSNTEVENIENNESTKKTESTENIEKTEESDASTTEIINNENIIPEQITGFRNKFKSLFENKIANAQEDTSLLEGVVNETINKIETITKDNLISNENQPETIQEIATGEGTENKFIDIWYSLDGETWWQLASISKNYLSNALNGGYFGYDLSLVKNREDMKNLKIKVEGVSETDSLIFYLDSVWLEADYQKEEIVPEEESKEIINLALNPDFENSQIKKDVQEENLRAVILDRGGLFELWYYVTNTDPNIPSSLVTGWTFLKGNSSIDPSSPLAIKDGNIFWLDACKQTIFGFSTDIKSLFGVPINQTGEESYLEFKNSKNENWKAVVLNEPDGDRFEFIPLSP